ncbi:hypothetical protein LSH36_979g01071 [Paralvinella palmiformis]|uniref:Uncharacterized protein n=1 Tax=Paralvinella palmiformis TaxID=53620 RepID=A0AAD9IX79_9ANNE|nr:hypothetical protein LSH36_979g01071 [Paralvinella palmiformis]
MPSECKLYVGALGRDTTKKDLEHAFGYYGQLVDVWMPRNSQGFAFVEFEDSRDAADALKSMDGTEVCGARIRVEFSSDRRGQRSRGGAGAFRGRGARRFNRDDKCYACGEHGHYAYDCRQNTRGGRRRSRSNSPRYGGGGGGGGGSRRSYSRSRSRSVSPNKDRYRRSPPRYQRSSRSRSPDDSYRRRSRSESPRRRQNCYE